MSDLLPPPDMTPCRHCKRPLGEHCAGQPCKCAHLSGYGTETGDDNGKKDISGE